MAQPALIESKDGAGQGPASLDSVLGFHIRLAHGAVYRHFSETFATLGLTQKQVSTLWLVAEMPGIAQSELGNRLRMDRATAMSIVSRMQERGYLWRERCPSDGRKQLLHLTDEGRNALDQAKTCIEEHERWLKSRFTSDEVKKLVEMLARIHE
ncbi:MarR family transcriptional regulator [Aurantiacibacter xanthus]|uniref:MarR family transcriptional regulator n=1 Tax=Aurantiacibacter xanthus TaxID=1784712 RepID=A0A3A1P1G2_9SPHN|nr:MarR family winged helix-turn-helix transcriptional regulator [Aurantiacibacter xanthus]RIV82997.1 MarR family transcriptional regulator [Aurantiacibacter xanthus]